MSPRHFAADDFDGDGDGLDPTADPVAVLASRRSRAGRARVSEAMSLPVTVRADASLEDVANILEARKLHGLAVVDADDRLLGVVTRTDVLRRFRRAASEGALEDEVAGAALPPLPQATAAGDVAVPACATVSDTATIAEAAELLASKKIHQVPVVLRSGKLVGFVTALDLARWLARR